MPISITRLKTTLLACWKKLSAYTTYTCARGVVTNSLRSSCWVACRDQRRGIGDLWRLDAWWWQIQSERERILRMEADTKYMIQPLFPPFYLYSCVAGLTDERRWTGMCSKQPTQRSRVSREVMSWSFGKREGKLFFQTGWAFAGCAHVVNTACLWEAKNCVCTPGWMGRSLSVGWAVCLESRCAQLKYNTWVLSDVRHTFFKRPLPWSHT